MNKNVSTKEGVTDVYVSSSQAKIQLELSVVVLFDHSSRYKTRIFKYWLLSES